MTDSGINMLINSENEKREGERRRKNECSPRCTIKARKSQLYL